MSFDSDVGLFDLLFKLEVQLMDPDFRRDREKVAAVLAEDFREFGSSGRFWTREAILEWMASEEAFPPPTVEDFAVGMLSPDVVLVTYRAVRDGAAEKARRETLRSSIWVRRAGGWQILFHQGTTVPAS
jgi:hypothetical protein